ncbi:MAG: hypothetical protein JOY98_15540 [Candidatus Eremiobacteraeota bacterium]|nr:hypothetical protein [Candidatus Eremiobacteraeota bacterium]
MRTIASLCVCAALATLAPAAASAATGIAYLTGPPACTTTGAQAPSPNVPRPQIAPVGTDAWMNYPSMPRAMTVPGRGQDPNDIAANLFGFEPAYWQPAAPSKPKVTPALPEIGAGAKIDFVISTCAS